MSLLMDALKKAEQAKAQQQGHNDQPSSVAAADLPEIQALAETPSPAISSAEISDSVSEESVATPRADEGVELSLDDVEVLPPVFLEKPEQIPEEMSLVESPADEPLDLSVDAPPDTESAPDPVSPSIPEQPSTPPQSPAPAVNAVPESEVKSDPDQQPEPEPKPDSAPESSGEPLAPPQTAVTTETAAKATPAPLLVGKRKFNRTYLWAGLVVLMALVGIAYYLMAVLAPMQQSSVVLPLSNQSLADENSLIAAEPAPSSDSLASLQVSAESQSEAPAESRLPAPSLTQPPVNATAAKQPPQANQLNQVNAVAAKPKPKAKLKPVVASPAVQIVPKQAWLIERSTVEDPLFRQLQQAYGAYQNGNFDLAEQRYRQVLARDASNRDALLGLAAIAQRANRQADARRLYRRLLTLNPKDSRAAAGLMALSEQGGIGYNITQLKMMLSEEPAAAHLYFALGNEYAAQSLWPQAQQAYFNAYRYAPTRAEYAYNLAVSLEQIGQPQAALSYYLQAQQASANGPQSFDADQVEQRIAVIRAGGWR